MTAEKQVDKCQKNDLTVNIGFASVAGIKAVNEDAVRGFIPDSQHAIVNKGLAVVIADGVSSAEAGQQASQHSVNTFLEEYFRTPDTWSVKHAGQQTLSAINLNLYKKSHAFVQQEKGFLCTFTGLVIKSNTAHFFHAGDSRLYRYSAGALSQLTEDHTVNIGGGKNILSRAVGMDSMLHIDYGKLLLQQHDLLLLTTDGVHDFVSSESIEQALNADCHPQQMCDRLVKLAELAYSDDNISCAVVQLVNLPKESRDDLNAKLTRLPFPPELEPGMKLDGYRIDKLLFASSRSQVYRVTDLQSEQQLVMKTPSVNFQDDVHYIDRFIQEEWIGKRIDSPYVVKIISQNRARTCLYYLMEPVEGISLDKWMQQNPLPSPKKAIAIVRQVAKALKAFHDTETIHQDLKPANIMLDEQLKVKVIDFGSVFVAGLAEVFVPLEHEGALGTASYSDPHYLLGKNTSVQGDIYALATITYELFTGHLPFGEKIEQCRTSHDFDKLRYISSSSHNPVVPIWFDRALAKGVDLDLSKRYQRLQDFVDDISYPNPQFLKDDPSIQKSRGLMFWQLMSAFWILTLVIVVVLFSTSN